MKKSFYLLFCICCLLFATGCGKSSKESPVEDFLYEMNNGEVIITGYKGTDLEIYIPSKINGRPVTTIGEEAFRGYDMTHITIPDSVIVIEDWAFNRCERLTSIDFSKNLEKISMCSFQGCEALTRVSLPESLEKIESSAFELCTSLKTVSLPESLKYLGADAFARCEDLKSLKIPYATQMEITVTEFTYFDVKTVSFDSPVGGSSVQYSSNTSNSTSKFQELHTKLIVAEGSYAHSQASKFLEYGLTVEVE